MSPEDLERLAAEDFDRAQEAWHADPTAENRAAYEAATWAFQAAVVNVIEQANR